MPADPGDGRLAPGRRGQGFEALAERHLRARGLRPLSRNFSCRSGELDLVMLDGQVLVFVEVRYRRSRRYGGAAESVDRRKQARILRAAQYFLITHAEFAGHDCRFDVVAIEGEGAARVTDWIAGAFSA